MEYSNIYSQQGHGTQPSSSHLPSNLNYYDLNSFNANEWNIPNLQFDQTEQELSLVPYEVGVGSIIYMQSKQYCPYTIFCDRADYHEGAVENEFCNQAPMQDTGLSHPALVIAVMQRPQSLVVGDLLCKIVPVHTWRKTSLRVYWQLRQTLRKFRDTIPIYKDSAENSEAYESRGYPFLHLDGGHLRYQSYINFNHTYTVPISYLRAYSRIHARSAFDIMLGRASYYKLMGWLGLSPQPYLTQWELVATGMERLRAMAAAQSAYGGMFQAPAVNYGTWTEPSEETRAALAKRDRSMALTYHEAVAVQEYDNLYANQPYGGY